MWFRVGRSVSGVQAFGCGVEGLGLRVGGEGLGLTLAWLGVRLRVESWG